MNEKLTGAIIRQTFIDFFVEHGHTIVPSSSLVPGGDATLLFTNAGMVQFKDVFLGTDHRPYTRAANSQKCLRVAGKHNDLDEVGRDNTHHTFFEMLGNWSFGDYYKKEAIEWAWQLLTEVWGIEKSLLWATCFKDDKGDIPTDEEAAQNWRAQPGMLPEHVVYSGRKDNFWEMAETGPCGPCSEINIDMGLEACDKQDVPGHVCQVNGDCKRFIEIWNLVFIQYNRLSPTELAPLPAKHVDTGMGLDRLVSVLQSANSNYRTDLFWPMLEKVRSLTGHTPQQLEENLTPYRVIADHARASAFLIADGVVPGNTGRNYIVRMIIRRAARFGTKIGLKEPFMAQVAGVVIDNYGSAYPELERNRATILDALTREEIRFKRTVEQGLEHLQELLDEVKNGGQVVLAGEKAFDLYATHGLPLELTRDVAREQFLDVDQEGFNRAKEEHSLASGAGKAMGAMGGDQVETYRAIFQDLQKREILGVGGVAYDPYRALEVEGPVLAIVQNAEQVKEAITGDVVEVVLPATSFYIESGGQVGDTGMIVSASEPRWEIRVDEIRKPAAGMITHIGEVVRGKPAVGDVAIAAVDAQRRSDIMRNHTATHLLHAELHHVLGDHARQAGSLVAPDRLRFDFTHSEAVSPEQLEQIEAGVNRDILDNYALKITQKPLAQALEEGAMALFGEKYGDVVRTITIGGEDPFSYELCGGTHVDHTGDIGIFLITSEGSAAAGVRRIEAVTGREAYNLVQHRFKLMKRTAETLVSAVDDLDKKAENLVNEVSSAQKEISQLRQALAVAEFEPLMKKAREISGVRLLVEVLKNEDADTMRALTDIYRNAFVTGVVVLGSVVNDRPMVIAAVSDDLVKKGWHAGDLVKTVASVIGGSGGGRPNLAQAGGKDASKLHEAMDQVLPWITKKLG